MLFGDKLSEIREKKKISRGDLSKKIGVHAPVVGMYEKTGVNPFIEVALKIVKTLNISINYLAGRTYLIMRKGIVNRMQYIKKLCNEDKGHLFALRCISAKVQYSK